MGNLLGLPLATLADLAPPPPPPPLWGFHHIPVRFPLSPITGAAPSPSAAPSVVENIILCVAAAVPVLLALVPLFILLVTGSVQRTRSDYSWIDAVTSNGFMLVLNYSYLMIVYSHRRCLFKGIILSVIVIPCIVFLFAAMRWQAILPEKLQYLLGSLGLISLFITYVCQIGDIYGQRGKTRPLEAVITAVNFTPSLVFNAAVCYVTWVYHQDEVFLWLSSLLNCICSLIGIFLLMEKVFRDYCSSHGDDGDFPEAGLPVRNNTNPLALGSVRTGPNAPLIVFGTSSSGRANPLALGDVTTGSNASLLASRTSSSGCANPLALGDVRTSSNASLLASRTSSSGCENSLLVVQTRTGPDAPDVDRGMSSSEFVTSAIEGTINLDDIHETSMSRSSAVSSPKYAVTIGEVSSYSLAPTSTGHRVLGCAAVLDRIPDSSDKFDWNKFERGVPGGSERVQQNLANKPAPQVCDTVSGWCCVPKNMRRRRMHMRNQEVVGIVA